MFIVRRNRGNKRGGTNIKASTNAQRAERGVDGISIILYIQLCELMLSMHPKCLCSLFLPHAPTVFIL